MSDMNIKVDMGRVQSSVQAAIRPAVETALASVDLKKMIADYLMTKPEVSDRERMYFSVFATPQVPCSLLETLIKESVSELAKQYVQTQIAMQRGDIEESFRKMMQGSTSRLVKAFASATERALKDDWGFELKIDVEHTVAEVDRDD